MPINFPDAPTTGTVYTIGDKTWTFDGTAWNLVTSSGSDHGGLGGLEDDDHTQYALADGSRGTFETSGAVSTHEAAADPHTQYLLADGTRTATELTVSGDLTVDTNTLFVDSTNNRVGIGTTSPAEELHIAKDQNGDLTQILIENLDQRVRIGSYYEAGVIQYGKIQSEQDTGGDIALALNPEGGNVGVGTTVPSARLQVEGNIQFGTGGTYGAGQLYSDANWGAILRARQSSPAVADFSFRSGSDTERMRIDSAGHITMPFQPCFYAFVGGANPSLGAGWVVVPLNSELFDINSDFNTSTYRFVAPVSGVYMFAATFNAYNIDVSQNGSQFVASFYKNGSEYSRVYQSGQYTSAGNDRNGSGSTIIPLSANDYVDFRLYSPDTGWNMSAGAVWNAMSGFLIG